MTQRIARAKHFASLLHRLIGQPLFRDRARTSVTVLAVALGVATVVAIDLAGEASAGSFRSSMETLQGSASYEIRQVGGIPEGLYGELARLPEPLRFSARVEGYGMVPGTGERVPVFGVDLLGDPMLRGWGGIDGADLSTLTGSRAVWVSPALEAEPGDRIDLIFNDHAETLDVQGVLQDTHFQGASLGRMVLADIALAQRLLDRTGRLDRIYVQAPEEGDPKRAESLRRHLPPSAELSEAGIQSRQNRKMLSAFRWNVRVLSYIALLVGAFLVYNAVAVSVVRRRPQIGIVRALGASQRMVRWGFLVEGGLLGICGAALGLPLGQLFAFAAVEAMGQTVEALYVSSAPGAVEIRPWTVALSVITGMGVALASAWRPAHEAAAVRPTEAMARARRDYLARGSSRKWAGIALGLAGLAVALCFVPAWERIPLAGYAAALALIAAAALVTPQAAASGLRLVERLFAMPFGVAGTLGARGLTASLARTAVIVAALCTATAMMVSVGVMVGSFRETVSLWMDRQLQADLYLRPEGPSAPDQSPTMSEEVALRVEQSPEVAAVDRFRVHAIEYGGLPARLGLGDVRVHGRRAGIRFLEGLRPETIWDRLTSGDSVIVSEPFSNKHDVHAGDTIALPLGPDGVRFQVEGVYYDYSGEQGYLIGDRSNLLRYLPDRRLSSLSVYLREGSDAEEARASIVRTLSGSNVQVTRNRDLRERALVVFDRTFAITYALEAIAVIVAILGMAGALIILVIDRRADLGVLRVLGASQSQVRRLVLAQAGMLGLISTATGCLLGGGLSLILIKVINKQSFGWTIQFHWPIAFLLAALAAIWAASFVAGVYPARMAAALNPVGVLHEE